MANFCNYEIRAKGSKKALECLFNMIPVLDDIYYDIYVENECGQDNNYHIVISGNCKWSLNYGCQEKEGLILNIDNISEKDINDGFGSDYLELTMRQKSEILSIEIQAHYWSEESNSDKFDHYINGKCIKQRKIFYNSENIFDWNTLEFIGHEGEYDENVDGEEQDSDFMSALQILLGRNTGEHINAEETAPSHIKGTKPSITHMSFTEGKHLTIDDWTFTIPDGFCRIDSKENRPFELVPHNFETADSAPIRILPYSIVPAGIIDIQMIHPYARKGYLEFLANITAEKMEKIPFSNLEKIDSAIWDDIGGYILLQSSFTNMYHYYITIIRGTKRIQFHVQANHINKIQSNSLNDSLIQWMKTFRFNASNKEIFEILIDKEECFTDLQNGKFKLFKKAIAQANQEYIISINGCIKLLEFNIQHGNFDKNPEDFILKILKNGFEVKEFFALKIDTLLNRLISCNTNAQIMSEIYHLLDEFIQNETRSIKVDDKAIRTAVPDTLNKLYNKWTKLKPQKKRYSDLYYTWKTEYAEVKKAFNKELDEAIISYQNNLIKDIEDQYNLEIKSVAEQSEKLKKARRKASVKLSELGIFQISKKSAIQKEIADIDEKIDKLPTAYELKLNRQKEISKTKERAEQKRTEIAKSIITKYKFPKKPMIENYDITDFKQPGQSAFTSPFYDAIIYAILAYMEPGKRYTISQLYNFMDDSFKIQVKRYGNYDAEVTIHTVAALVTKLVNMQYLSEEIIESINYYHLTDTLL